MPHRAFNRLLAGTAMAVLLSTPAMADTVTLKTLDETFSVQGEIISFDGQNYTVQTAIGNVVVAANLVTCDGAGCPVIEVETVEFAIAGEKTLGLRLIPALLDEYSDSRGANIRTSEATDARVVFEVTGGNVPGDAQITVLPTDSSAGLDALFRGDATFALSSRPARNREARAFEEFGLGNLRDASQETIVALDGLIVVTHPDNPVRAITEGNVALTFGGRINTWAELGGSDAPINLYIRDQTSGSNEVFENLIMRPNGLTIGGNITALDSDEAIAQAVLDDPNGIGVTGFASVGDTQALAIEGECGLQIPPSAFAIKTEEYPLTRLLYMYQTNQPQPTQVAAFHDFVTSEGVQSLVSDAGFIDQSITEESINAQGIRVASAVIGRQEADEVAQIQDMLTSLIAADRLSTTFRFETGSANLNARAQADVVRLAELLGSEKFANKEIQFIGFTDSVGDAELNRQLSEQRAEQVLASVVQSNPQLASTVRMSTLGYGEISPLGCNESNAGRLINRRVEVWVKDIVAASRG